jgi:hypothetical protein
MGLEVRFERRGSRPLAVVRRRAAAGELSRVVPEACGVVWGAVRARGIAGAGRHVAVYREGRDEVEVGVELGAPFGGHGEVLDSATPAGLVAVATHLGPYAGLGAAHEAIRRRIASEGHAPAGVSWETYDHWREAWDRDPSGIATEVAYLLAEGGPGSWASRRGRVDVGFLEKQ